ncbi:MAG: FAD-dependent oxidoreductase [Acidobacteriota bacterium]
MDEPRSNDLSRRALLRGAAAAGALLAAPAHASSSPASGAAQPVKTLAGKGKQPHITVIGAGVFGAFTALALRQRGAEVTLIDAWGAGHSRSSSGGETRVIRGVYADRVYVELAARAFELWPEFEKRVGHTIYRRTGALWMVSDSGDFVRQAAANLKAVGFAYEEMTTTEAAKRFPQVAFDGVHWALWEPHAGFLLARQACGLAAEELVKQGGKFRLARVLPFEPANAAPLHEVQLANGPAQQADAFVFACGPWLGQMLPGAVGNHIQATRQEVFYFGTPAGETRFDPDTMPVWVDVGERLYYGIPGNERRGFKIADDTRGETIDPTTEERVPTPEALSRARAFIAQRFPALAGAPLVESRVCQYENSPDHQFILDRHPQADNVWIIGGGSGHGFKFGPAWGERVAQTVLGERPLDPFFGLARLEKKAFVTPRDLRGERPA